MKSFYQNSYLSASIAAALALTAGDTLAAGQTAALEEVVVTAQRRAESIQDVPIAVVAASQEQLETAGVSSFKDIAMIDSGIVVNDSNNFVFPFIRGVGSFIQSGSTNSSVAVYMDGVYLPRLSSSALELDNIAQVEILKGPQATLYGRNATGGTVKISTRVANPGDELEGKVSATVGDYGNKRASFFVSGGMSESVAANMSGYIAKRDGFTKNLASSNLDVSDFDQVKGDDLDNLNSYYINGKLTYEPTDELQFIVSAYKSEYDGSAASGLRQLDPVTASFTMSAFTGGLVPPAAFQFSTRDHETYGHADRTYNSSGGASLKVSYELDTMEFMSLTAANSVKSNASTELFEANIPLAGFEGVTNSEDFSQEFQLTVVDGEGLDWMIGMSYFQEESNDYEDLVGIQFLPTGPIAPVSSRVDWSVEAKSLFAELYYPLTDALTLTLGARYTDEIFEATPVVDFIDPSGIGIKQDVKDDALTYRAVLDYNTDWGLLYGSIATGFKSGGLVTANVSAGPYDAEELTSYEIGVKSTLASGSVRLNAALFMYDFTQIQAQTVGSPDTGGAVFIVSGDEADVSGFEVGLDALVTDSFTVQAGMTLLFDNEYKDFVVPANPAAKIPAIDAGGNVMVGSAELIAVLGGQYLVELSDHGSLIFSANVNYNSGYYHTIDNVIGTGGLDDDGYTVVNTRVSFLSADESWELALWANNITDEYFIRSGLSAFGGGTKLGLEGAPRHYGLTAKYSF